MLKGIEAIFVGILALVLLGAAIYFFFGGGFNRGGNVPPPTGPVITIPDGSSGPVPTSAEDVLCQCYDQARDLAGQDVGVMSSQYRTGFESCRAVGGARGGDAWTAGWNSRISSKPFQASCRAWLRGEV